MLGFALCMNLSAQTKTITGLIVDKTSVPVIGASVIEHGTAGNGKITYIDGKFSLKINTGNLTDFATVFATTNEANKEIIFGINFADGEATSDISNFLYADANIVSFYDANGVKLGDPLNLKGTAIQRYEYIQSFWSSFSAKDKRRAATFMEYYDKDKNLKGTVVKKFIGSISSIGARVYDTNEPMYRYADVLLMLAEVENMKGGDPAQYINQIRQRAYGNDYSAATDAYVNSVFKANEYAILAERDKEFVYEGKRWYDVIRMKDGVNGNPLAFDASSTYGTNPVLKTTETYKVLWPVDKNALNGDTTLKQTPGFKVATQEEEVW